MIGKLTGINAGRTSEGALLVDVHGVGYVVRTPLSLSGNVEGQPVSILVHTVVREDAIDLYGFAGAEELEFFKLLMSVSGIGPKTALGILNVAEVSALKRAIAQGDTALLVKGFGIGKKSAERMVVELREKMEPTDASQLSAADDSSDGEVLAALQALGYSVAECRTALRAARDSGATDTRGRIGAALKHLGSR